MLDAIENGTKTVTRRLIKTEKCPYTVGRIYQATNRPRWTASGTKSNAKGGWRSIPIKIVSIQKEKLWDITDADATHEGFSGMFSPKIRAREQFFWIWGAIHGTDVPMNVEVWRIEFKRVPESWK